MGKTNLTYFGDRNRQSKTGYNFLFNVVIKFEIGLESTDPNRNHMRGWINYFHFVLIL